MVRRPTYLRSKRAWCFIHVPKTGGTSIGGVLGPDPYHDPSTPVTHGQNLTHLWARDIRNHVGHERWSRIFSFGTIRNPWARVVSLYRTRDSKMPFNEWMDQVDTLELQQWHRISDESEDCIVNFVLNFDHLERDWKTVCTQLGLPPAQLPRLNAAAHRVNYRSFFQDVDHIELVRELCHREIELFNYSF